MPKKKKLELKAVIRGGLDKGIPYTNMEDQINFGQRIETKGISHPTIKDVPWCGKDGPSSTIGKNEYGVRKKK